MKHEVFVLGGQRIDQKSKTDHCSLLHPHTSIGVHLCVTVQYITFQMSTRSRMEARPHKRKLLGGVMHSTITMGQVGLVFSRRQQCLFKIKIGTFKDIKVWSSQGLKRR